MDFDYSLNPFTRKLGKHVSSTYLDSTYLKLDGSNANTDINIGSYGIIMNYGTIGNLSFSTDEITSTTGQIVFNDDFYAQDIYIDKVSAGLDEGALLSFDSPTTRVNQISFYNNNILQWVERHETSADGNDLVFRRHNLSGTYIDTPLTINWTDGDVEIAHNLDANNGTVYGGQVVSNVDLYSTTGGLYLAGSGYPFYLNQEYLTWVADFDSGDAAGDFASGILRLGSYDLVTMGYNVGAKDAIGLGDNNQIKIHGASYYADDLIEFYGGNIYMDSNPNLHFNDNNYLYLGSGDDFKFHHDGTNAYIEADNSSYIYLLNNAAAAQYIAWFKGARQSSITGLRISNTAATANVANASIIDFSTKTSTSDRTIGLIEAQFDISTTDASRTGSLLFSAVNNASRIDLLRLGADSVSGTNYARITADLNLVGSGTDATSLWDGSGASTGSLRYESDNDKFVFDDDVDISGNVSITGTLTYTSYTDVGSIGTFLSALSSARPGDMVRLAPGDYDNGGDQIVIPSGVSIERVGSGTVTIYGTLLCSQDVNEKFTTTIKGITVDSTDATTKATYGMNEFKNGNFFIIDTTFTSNKPTGMGNLVTFSAYDRPVKADMINCTVYGATNDGISTKANSTTYGAESYLKLRNVYSYGNGSASNDQALTSHDKFRIEAHNCTLSAHTETGVTHDAVLQESVASPIALYNCKCYGSVGAQTVVGCYIELTTALTTSVALTISSGADGFVSDCTINGKGTNGYQGIKINGETGDKHIIQNNHIFDFYYDGANEAAIYCDANGTSVVHILNNKISGFLRGLELRYSDTTAYIYVKGNYFSGATNYNVLSSASHTLVESEYNYFDENKFYLFTPSALDILKWKINDDTEITGDVDITGDITLSGDAVITGDGTNRALTIYQGADDKGIYLYGYDDRSSSYLRMEINSFGAAVMYTSGGLYTNGFSLLDNSNGRIGGNSNYWYNYDSTYDEFQFWTTNSDGSGTNQKLIQIDDGTVNMYFDANLFLKTIKSGATQAGAGAATGEIWKTASHATLPDNVLMIGV